MTAPRQDPLRFGAKLPTTTTRVLDAAAEIMGDPNPGELAFLHTVLAQCFLPYRQPPGEARDYHRSNGRVSLVVSAGYLLHPETGEMVLQGLPYGAKPRLLMGHLCTEAVRNQSPVVPIADSMSAFMKSLGLQPTGGKRGSIGGFKEQLNRLAASRLQLGMRFDNRATTVNSQIIEQFDVWFPEDPRQRMLWPSTVVLSEKFFASLKDHALPLDPRALRGIQHNARALDIYAWLSYRLPRVRRRTGDPVSWGALEGQFGGAIASHRKFRQSFRQALRLVLAIYPRADVEEMDQGLRLRPSPPPIIPKARRLA